MTKYKKIRNKSLIEQWNEQVKIQNDLIELEKDKMSYTVNTINGELVDIELFTNNQVLKDWIISKGFT